MMTIEKINQKLKENSPFNILPVSSRVDLSFIDGRFEIQGKYCSDYDLTDDPNAYHIEIDRNKYPLLINYAIEGILDIDKPILINYDKEKDVTIGRSEKGTRYGMIVLKPKHILVEEDFLSDKNT